MPYKAGQYHQICDVCGFKLLSHKTKLRWDGLIVCPADYETDHPQKFVRGVSDGLGVEYPRPEPTDVFTNVAYIEYTPPSTTFPAAPTTPAPPPPPTAPTPLLLDTFTAADGTDPASRDMDVYPSGAPRWITDIQGTIEANQLTRRTASASMNLYLTNPGYAPFFDTTTYAAIVDITATDSISFVGIGLYSGNFDSASPEISIDRIPGTLRVRVSNNRTTGGPVLDLSVSASAYVGQEMRCAVYANGDSYSLIVNGAVVASGTQALSSMAVDEIGASVYVPSAGLTPKPSINRVGLYKSLTLEQAIALTATS